MGSVLNLESITNYGIDIWLSLAWWWLGLCGRDLSWLCPGLACLSLVMSWLGLACPGLGLTLSWLGLAGLGLALAWSALALTGW